MYEVILRSDLATSVGTVSLNTYTSRELSLILTATERMSRWLWLHIQGVSDCSDFKSMVLALALTVPLGFACSL